MIRRENLLRAWLLIGMLASLMVLSTANTASAQDVLPCNNCDYGTIYVSDQVTCKFDVCIKDADGLTCITVGPGSTELFKCHEKAQIFLKNCKGQLVQINDNDDNCVFCVCVGFNGRCCPVDACVGYDEKGCLYVKISPSVCDIAC